MRRLQSVTSYLGFLGFETSDCQPFSTFRGLSDKELRNVELVLTNDVGRKDDALQAV